MDIELLFLRVLRASVFPQFYLNRELCIWLVPTTAVARISQKVLNENRVAQTECYPCRDQSYKLEGDHFRYGILYILASSL